MALSFRLVAGVLLVLALALLSSSAEERSAGRAATVSAMGSDHDQTSEAPVPPLRPLGSRKPVAAPPPPRPAHPRASIRPFPPPRPSQPQPQPPPPPPRS
ncbi:uncharacterized protein LOC100501248 precursor [Zea mays]|jgi:hypothetical protein|uniref:Uncharacterized protein n=1 Tax=Zea mays TaxID=4577 RepID=B6TQL9_MAIZE|nr:uncharacterized protein LOC100501248 precursor [Zea mays]ACG39402.1 hypothetical protein [Zea mays]ACR35238.1 unknown [Zea mays]|eukprot:NP_001182949.1 uncharacterized protein LOC100501248 precursor [Zea mays]